MRTGKRSKGRSGPVVDIENPTPGIYRLRLRSGAVYSAIRLWYGPPSDPVTGEEMDRMHRWQATANGQPIPYERVWPACEAEPIDQAEYDHLMKTFEWGKTHAPDSPQANPHKRVDPLSAPILF
jgi:hypothetical protein